jgi:hypothetical protein
MTREEIIAANPIAEFVRSRGHELKPAGQNFVTNSCPVTVHKKKWHRPVSIDVKRGFWFCNDCEMGGTVIDWVMRERGCNAAQAKRELGGGGNNSESHGKIVEAYDYSDKDGKLLFQICRKDPKSDFPVRRPDGHGNWIWNVQGVRRVLYRLPEVLKARLVCVAEGEKDCDNLAKLGFVATTNPFGAGKWRDKYSETLRGKDVIVFGDVGDPKKEGERHTEQVIASLAGKAKSIKHVVLPDGFHDISDYIASVREETAGDTIAKLIEQTVEVQPQEAPEPLPPPPAAYVSPPLILLPAVLQDYVQAGAESLNVDVSYIFLPLLSSLGAAIGNSRSIILKRGFIQPPVIWTGVIGPTGSLKSPGLETGYFPVLEHEREFKRQNQQAQALFEEDHATWKSQSAKKRGPEPEKPVILTCLMDDLTMEVLSDRLASNPRGVLVAKDEISHWFASFDQYKNAKGSDVSRWLSLHTAVFLAVDRLKDNRHHRIWMPRVCITGGIQPKVLRRVLTEEFFERGLPARFLFAYPKTTPAHWSEKTVSDELQNEVLELFENLWLLQPKHDDHGQVQPEFLRLDDEAKQIFIAFYNECGAASVETDEHEAAVWCKLSGYAARLALVGQVARDPNARAVTGEVMQAACDLAKWFGDEAIRIYATLAETREQREQRELVEFIERRGRKVTVREVTQLFRPLKNNRDEAEHRLNMLVRAKRGEWIEAKGARGPATCEFHLLQLSTSTGSEDSPSVEPKPVDVDSPNSQENDGSGSSLDGAVSGEVDISERTADHDAQPQPDEPESETVSGDMKL